jgi:hypothetical protein
MIAGPTAFMCGLPYQAYVFITCLGHLGPDIEVPPISANDGVSDFYR